MYVARPGEPCWSIIANTLGDVEKFFKETVDNRDEGIVLKDLGSKWEPGDRSGKWLKLKPDYVHASSDLDVLVIGGYFGSGRRGGEIGQFLVGLAMTSIEGGYPSRFMSFCRVGSGLSDEELNKLVMKLKPYFKKNDNSTKSTPRFYEVTNHSKERPDVWIDSPEKSIILSISSDIRTIKSEVFASPYSLRFPRIQHVRYDKPWYECLDVKSFVDLVQSSNGNLQSNSTVSVVSKQKKKPASRRSVLAAVPEHFIQTDVSNVVKDAESLSFKNMMFYFVNVPSSYTLDFFHKLVVENGGDFSMNLNESVTHCIAAESKGIKYQAAIHRGDVIHYSWVLDCCSGKCGVKPPRRYYMFLSESTKRKLHELGEADVLGESYYSDVDLADIKQIFRSIDKNAKSASSRDKSEYYKKKYFGDKSRWLFSDCFIYFYEQPSRLASIKSLIDLQLRRMKFQVVVHGGEVVGKTGDATHVIIFGNSNEDVDQCETMLDDIPSDNKRLRIVRQSWLEDSVAKGRRLDENPYDLRPGYFKEGIDNFPVFPTATIEKQPTQKHHTKNKSVLEGPARRVIKAAPTRKIAKTRRPPPRKRKSARIENESGSEVSSVSGGSKEERGDLFASQSMKDQDGTERNSHDQFHATLPEVRKNEGGDLVHDFMLDMVPSLAHKSDDGSTSLARQESDRVVGAPTEKKRKVSYKDIVDKLLKD